MKSQTLQVALFNFDEQIFDLEMENQRLKNEIIELKKEISLSVNKQLEENNYMIGQTFLACLDVSELQSLGTVGATVVNKIRSMKNINDIHAYIDKVFKITKENTILSI